MKTYRVEYMVLALMIVLQVRNPRAHGSLVLIYPLTGHGKSRQSRWNKPTFAVSCCTAPPDVV
jgi:hypothetical protein